MKFDCFDGIASTVCIDTLKPGSVFSYNGNIYMLVKDETINVNSYVNLKSGCIEYIYPHDVVLVDVVLHAVDYSTSMLENF